MKGVGILIIWMATLIWHQVLADINDNQISKSNHENVDDYIASLDYDPDNLLKFEGELVKVSKRYGFLDGNQFIVISHDKKSVNRNTSDFSVDHANEQKIMPGNLLLANSHLINGNPDFVNLRTKRLIYNIGHHNFQIIPTSSNYQSTVNNIIKHHQEDFKPVTSWKHKLIHSPDQLRVEFGLDQDLDKLGIDFDAIKNKSQLAAIYQFKQIFYNVDLNHKHLRASNLLSELVTPQKLAEKNVNSQNPLLVVDSVSYGNLGYLILITSSADNSTQAILDEGREKMYDHLEDLNLRIVYMKEGRLEIFQDLKQTKNLMKLARDEIAANFKFNQTSLGFPISYSARFFKDQKQAVMKSFAEYVETKKEVFDGGVIKLYQDGLFVAQFHLEWDEIKYDEQGEEVRVRKYWSGNGEDKLFTFRELIEFKGNTRNIAVKAWECTFLAWEWWRLILDEPYIPLLGYRQITISGYSLNPFYIIDPPISE